jgi:peptide/nickel transport system permease protein
MVQGVILLLGAIFMLLNLAVDVLYAALDPRLRHG